MRTKKQQQDFMVTAIALGVACVVVVALVVAVAPWRQERFDAVTLCPGHGDYGRTVVLVDATDSLNSSQRKAVIDEMKNLPSSLDLHEQVSVFVLSEENLHLASPEIELCYPGDEGSANPLIQNPRRIQRHFEEKFQKPMADTIDLLAKTPPQRTSPIHEMLHAVALYRNFDSTKKRRLIVVSDLIQNTPPVYSQYSEGTDFSDWRNSAHGRDFPDFALRDVEVKVLYLKRPEEHAKRVQSRAHVLFWEKYFSALGASVTLVKPLQ